MNRIGACRRSISAAIGYSVVYMLAGGGLIGAAVIYVIAKSLGK